MNILSLIKSYLAAKTLEERERVAQIVLSEVAPPLMLFIKSRKLNAPAEDILQEVMIKIFKELGDFEGTTPASFWSWCYTITRNQIADGFNGRIMNSLTVIDPDLLKQALRGLESKGLSAAEWADLKWAIDLVSRTDAPCVQYFWDRFVNGLSYPDMGAEYGITEEAARKRVERCLALASGIT